MEITHEPTHTHTYILYHLYILKIVTASCTTKFEKRLLFDWICLQKSWLVHKFVIISLPSSFDKRRPRWYYVASIDRVGDILIYTWSQQLSKQISKFFIF